MQMQPQAQSGVRPEPPAVCRPKPPPPASQCSPPPSRAMAGGGQWLFCGELSRRASAAGARPGAAMPFQSAPSSPPERTLPAIGMQRSSSAAAAFSPYRRKNAQALRPLPKRLHEIEWTPPCSSQARSGAGGDTSPSRHRHHARCHSEQAPRRSERARCRSEQAIFRALDLSAELLGAYPAPSSAATSLATSPVQRAAVASAASPVAAAPASEAQGSLSPLGRAATEPAPRTPAAGDQVAQAPVVNNRAQLPPEALPLPQLVIRHRGGVRNRAWAPTVRKERSPAKDHEVAEASLEEECSGDTLLSSSVLGRRQKLKLRRGSWSCEPPYKQDSRRSSRGLRLSRRAQKLPCGVAATAKEADNSSPGCIDHEFQALLDRELGRVQGQVLTKDSPRLACELLEQELLALAL